MFFPGIMPAANLSIFFIIVLIALIIAVAIIGFIISIYFFGSKAQRRLGGESFAIPPVADQTALDQAIGPLAEGREDQSGLLLLPNNLAAFKARWQTARIAGRSLDLQYYYWKADLTGRLLCLELILAADRGTRVRLLLDDINSFRFDSSYLALDSHPNIEVRLFNPSRSRSDFFRRGLELIVKYFTATRRMHNKCWIADGRVAIAGGRNIGDAYFDASEQANFQDIDVLAIGKGVDDAEEIFDKYWNSEAALPIRTLLKRRTSSISKLRQRLQEFASEERARRFLSHAGCFETGSPWVTSPERFHWLTEVEVLADPPEKAAGKFPANWLGERINLLIKSATRSLHITSPYFIPGKAGSETLVNLVKNGVDVRVLTNSLAATDVIAVHGAYARYRKQLLLAAVKIFELKPEPGRHRASLFGSRTASLHTKALMVDGEIGFVGSFNLDPRSRSINTEMGILFRCPGLARQLHSIFENQTTPEVSYHVLPKSGELTWLDHRQGIPRLQNHEPDAPLRRIIPAALIAWLPIESQL